jgi:hypothetical protein
METEPDEMVQCGAQAQVGGRHGHPRGDLHAPLPVEQLTHVRDYPLVAAAASLGRTQPIVNGTHAIEADGDGEAVAFEEGAVLRRNERTVGRDRTTDPYLSFAGNPRGTLRRFPDQFPVHQRLTAKKGQVDPFAGHSLGEKSLHRRLRDLPGHVPCRTAEAAAFSIAIGAAQIAAFRHGQGQRPHRRIFEGSVADEALEAEAVPGKQRAYGVFSP